MVLCHEGQDSFFCFVSLEKGLCPCFETSLLRLRANADEGLTLETPAF